MSSATRPWSRKRSLSVALFSAVGLAAASVALPQAAAAETGAAEATGLEVQLGAAEDTILAHTSAPGEGGTHEDEVLDVDLGAEADEFGLRAGAVSSASTFDADGTSAESEVADAHLELFGTDVLHADLLDAQATCPVAGDTSAAANVVGLQLFDDAVDLGGDAPVTASAPVDVDLEDAVEAELTVTLSQVEQTDADSAAAAALVAEVQLETVLADDETVSDTGTIILTSATCERPADAAPDTDEDEAPDTDEDEGPDTDEDEGPDEAEPAGPSADELSPDTGPTDGGTIVTVVGEQLDTAEEATIDGAPLDFLVNDTGDELTFTTPSGEPGPVDVVITFGADTTATLTFTYEAPDGVDDTDADTETGTDADTETGTDADTETGTDADTETGTDADTDTDTETETGIEIDSETEADTGTEAETGTEIDSETEADTGTDTGLRTESGGDTGAVQAPTATADVDTAGDQATVDTLPETGSSSMALLTALALALMAAGAYLLLTDRRRVSA